MFDNKYNVAFFRPTSKEEFLSVLKYFSTEKFPSPHCWTVDFFLHFFEIMGEDFLDMIK